MLPVASPLRAATGHRERRSQHHFVDPLDTALGIGEHYQEIRDDYNALGYHPALSLNNGSYHQSGMSNVDLEAIKHQKIQEFRQALDLDIERKRQQAQTALEAAERLKWEQLMDFQQALQREMMQQTRVPTALYMGQQHQQQYQYQQHQHQQYTMNSMPHQMQQLQPRKSTAKYQSLGMAPVSVPQYLLESESQYDIPVSSPLSTARQRSLESPVRQRQGYYQPPTTPGRQDQTASPIRQRQQASPVRQAANTMYDSIYQQTHNEGHHHGKSPAAQSRYHERSSSPVRHHGMAADASHQQQGLGGHLNYDPNQSYHLPSQPSYSDPTRLRSLSRVSNTAMPQHRSMASSLVEQTPETYYRSHSQERQQGRRDDNDEIRGARAEKVDFNFDHADEERTYHRSGAKSAGAERTVPLQGSRSGVASSATLPSSPMGKSKELVDQVESLELEYAKLTGKSATPSRARALIEVRRIQDERRRKLEELTARVVQNRRRFAHEMKTADRPLEISFVESIANEMDVETRLHEKSHQLESREEDHPRRKHHVDTRGQWDEELRALDEEEESSGTETECAVAEDDEDEDDVVPRESKHKVEEEKQRRNRHKHDKQYRSDGNGRSGSELGKSRSRDGHTRNSVTTSRSKGSSRAKVDNDENEAKTTRKERKGKQIADDFMEKLRERRSHAVELEKVLAIKREDVLGAVEQGKTNVTLPTRDPKLARQNRRRSSLQLRNVDAKSSNAGLTINLAKIATKKSFAAASKPELEKDVARELDMSHIFEPKTNLNPPSSPNALSSDPGEKPTNSYQRIDQRGSFVKIKGHRKESSTSPAPTIHNKPTIGPKGRDHRSADRRRKNARGGSTTVSHVSDLSESLYGAVPSSTGSGVLFDRDASESTSSVFDDIHFDGPNMSDYPADDMSRVGGDAAGIKKLRKLKVREHSVNSVTEGFEIEDGNSLFSRPAFSSTRPLEEPMSNVEALHELERKLDEHDRRNLMPELLELTELYGWDIKDLLTHFAHFLPHLSKLDGCLDGSMGTMQLEAEATPVKAQDLTCRSPQSLSEGSHRKTSQTLTDRRKIPLKQSPEYRNPVTSTEIRAEVAEVREHNRAGWRSRVRSGISADQCSIDMGDVRSSLKSLLKRSRRQAQGAYKPELHSLNEH
jgi:hypothetical protein